MPKAFAMASLAVQMQQPRTALAGWHPQNHFSLLRGDDRFGRSQGILSDVAQAFDIHSDRLQSTDCAKGHPVCVREAEMEKSRLSRSA